MFITRIWCNKQGICLLIPAYISKPPPSPASWCSPLVPYWLCNQVVSLTVPIHKHWRTGRLLEDTQTWRRVYSLQTEREESFLRTCFCQMKEGTSNFWHYVPSRARRRSEAVHHLFFSNGKTLLQSALLHCCLLFIINHYAFNLCNPGAEAFLSKFKTLYVHSVHDI